MPAASVPAAWRGTRARYDVHPKRIVQGKVGSPDGLVRQGCVIAQGLRVGPFRLACAVRVDGLREDATSVELSYHTLAGHPERGRIAFTVAWDAATGRLEARVAQASVPALWWSRLGAPLAKRLQAPEPGRGAAAGRPDVSAYTQTASQLLGAVV